MSQKELLDEGIGSMLKKVAQTAGGAVGAVGGALKAVSDAGINATWTDAAKGGTEGAKKGWKGVKKALTGKDAEFNEMLEDRGWMLKGDFRTGKGNMRVFDVVELDYDETGQPTPGRPYPRSAAFKYEGGKWVQKRDPGYLRQEKEKDGDQEEDPHASERAEEADTPPEPPQPGARAAAEPGEATKPTRTRDHQKEYARRKELKAQKAAAEKEAGMSQHPEAIRSRKRRTAKKEVPKESFSQKNLLRRLHMLRG
tara:strand:- start:73 stop:834 length:762 start_codon:yes stop_codon:yes gene_type:complete